jgi:hypothetical protein
MRRSLGKSARRRSMRCQDTGLEPHRRAAGADGAVGNPREGSLVQAEHVSAEFVLGQHAKSATSHRRE